MPDISSYNGIDMGDIASINGQDAPSGGGTASTAPSVSVSTTAFGHTATITKSGGGAYTNPNYSASAALTSDASTITVADADIDRFLESDGTHLAGTLKLYDTNAASGERTLSVKAQEFGDTIQSSAGTATYTARVLQTEFLRIQGCTSDGTADANKLAIRDVRFYEGPDQTGQAYPTTDLSANDSETDIVVSRGKAFSSYYAYKAFNGVTTGADMAWLLTASASENWLQIQWEDGTYDTKPIIKSMKIHFAAAYNDATYFKLVKDDNSGFSSPTDLGIFQITAEDVYLTFS